MTKIYRFVGTYSEIGGYPDLTKFGQAIELPEDLGTDLIRRNTPLLPDAEFKALGFTDKELADHAYVGSHADAPVEFLDKKRKALVRLHEIRSKPEPAKIAVPVIPHKEGE